MNEAQAAPVKWWQPTFWKIRNKSWWWFLPVANWLHDKTKHCEGPEYFKAHPKMVRWTGGIKTFAWTWICGHHLGFSLHMGNIYWGLFKRKSAENEKKDALIIELQIQHSQGLYTPHHEADRRRLRALAVSQSQQIESLQLSVRRSEATIGELVEAIKNVLNQFESINAHQRKLLVKGQTLESASRNWEEATDIPGIDFEPLYKVLRSVEQGEK